MPSDPRKELREKVARHVEQYDTPKNDDPRRRYTKAQMEIAIAIVLEEAARVAREFPAQRHGHLATTPHAAAAQVADEIAAAIQGMIGKAG